MPKGAAIATDISQVLSCIFALWFFDESSGYLPHKSEETFH